MSNPMTAYIYVKYITCQNNRNAEFFPHLFTQVIHQIVECDKYADYPKSVGAEYCIIYIRQQHCLLQNLCVLFTGFFLQQ